MLSGGDIGDPWSNCSHAGSNIGPVLKWPGCLAARHGTSRALVHSPVGLRQETLLVSHSISSPVPSSQPSPRLPCPSMPVLATQASLCWACLAMHARPCQTFKRMPNDRSVPPGLHHNSARPHFVGHNGWRLPRLARSAHWCFVPHSVRRFPRSPAHGDAPSLLVRLRKLFSLPCMLDPQFRAEGLSLSSTSAFLFDLQSVLLCSLACQPLGWQPTPPCCKCKPVAHASSALAYQPK